MKIKTINDFTIEECKAYLDANPDGEHAEQVNKRLQYLSQINIEPIDDSSYISSNDFIKEFDRLYVTRKYADAFVLCLNSIKYTHLSELVSTKLNMILPLLSYKGVIPTPDGITMDYIIGLLMKNGYTKLSLKENGILYTLPYLKIIVQKNSIQVKLITIPFIASIILYPFIPIAICAFIIRKNISTLILMDIIQLAKEQHI